MTVVCNGGGLFSRCHAHVASPQRATDETPVGGINEEALHPLQRGLSTPPASPVRDTASVEMHQGVIQHRRALRQVVVGFRPRPRTRRAQDSKGGIRFLIVEDTRSFLPPGLAVALWPHRQGDACACRSGPLLHTVVVGCPVDSTEDGQQRVALVLGTSRSRRSSDARLGCAAPSGGSSMVF